MSMGYRNQSRGGGLPIRLIIAVVIALFSLVSYYSMRSENPITHEKQHVKLSVSDEIAMGLNAAPEMAQQFGGVSDDKAGQALVTRIGDRLVERTPAGSGDYRFQFHLLADAATVNAFALPGGQVFITEGLLRKLETEGQLAGVLGHEIGHVVHRHSAQHLAESELISGLTGAAALAAYDPNDPNSQRNAAVAAAIGQLVNMKFSRGDESQADAWAVETLPAAGYNPESMIGVMKILEAASKGGQPPEFLSTHPSPGNRIERIQAEIKKIYPNGLPAGLKD